MPRPKATVLLEHSDNNTKKVDQVIASDGIWSVFYQSNPINFKTISIKNVYPLIKYKQVSFSNKGHAVNLVKKLNKKFKTADFTVVLLTYDATVYSE
jgi:hypothetical protein